MRSISNDTLNRLSGIVMIVNILLPGLLVLLISIGSAYLVPGYLQEIRDAAKTMQDAANNAKTAAGEVATNIQTHATTAQKRLDGITQKVKDTKTAISKGIGKVPTKAARKGLKAAFAEVFTPLSPVADLAGDFKNIGVEIKKMDQLKTHFERFAANAKKVYDNLRGLIGFFDRWRVLLWAALIIVVAWVVLSYTLWAYRRLVIGLALMRGGDQVSRSW